MHFQHLEELLFPCSKVHLPPPLLSLSITLQKELNKTKLVKTLSSTFYPFETLQIGEVALILLSGFVDKENSSLNKDDEDEEQIIGKLLFERRILNKPSHHQ